MMELLLSLIYSFHFGKWDLLVECIRSVIPFTFAYDHINYARYLSALIGDILSLEDDYPDIYERFKVNFLMNFLPNCQMKVRFQDAKPIKSSK